MSKEKDIIVSKLKVLILLLALTSCVKTVTVSDYCTIADIICPQCPMVDEEQKLGQDTQETCEQIDLHNAVYEKLCK